MRRALTSVYFWLLVCLCGAIPEETTRGFGNEVHTFMYIWYGAPTANEDSGMTEYKHWDHEVLPHWEARVNKDYPQVGSHFKPPRELHSPYYPLHGPYSSNDSINLRRQFDQMKEAGIDVAVVSWWGQRSKKHATDTQGVNTDVVFEQLLRQADLHKGKSGTNGNENGIKIAIHLEPYPGRSITSVRDDINYIVDNYGHHKSLCREGGTNKGRIVYVNIVNMLSGVMLYV